MVCLIKPTDSQKKHKKKVAYIIMEFKHLKGRMDYRKLFHYLINKSVMESLFQVRQAVYEVGLKSKVVT